MTEVVGNAASCTCALCRSACERKPGWFAPGEVDVLAAAMGKTPQELFREALAVDYCRLDDGRDVFLLSPATVDIEPGSVWPFFPVGGTCRWYVGGRCAVHELGKPQECRKTWHGQPGTEVDWLADHIADAEAWVGHQDEVRRIAGFDPVAPEPDPVEVLLGLLESAANAR